MIEHEPYIYPSDVVMLYTGVLRRALKIHSIVPSDGAKMDSLVVLHILMKSESWSQLPVRFCSRI